MDAATTRAAVQDHAQFPVVKATPLVVPLLLKFDAGVSFDANLLNNVILNAYGRGLAKVGSDTPNNTWGREGRPFELRFYDVAKAAENGWPATNLAPNINSMHAYTDVSGWTATANCTITRSTAEHLFGPASARLVMAGLGANEGGYMVSGPLPITGDVGFRGWAKVGAGGSGGNVRPYIAEYDPTNTNLVGKTNGSSVAVPGSWSALAAFNRTGCVKGNVLRIGLESSATAANDVHLNAFYATSRSTLFPGAPDTGNYDGGSRSIEVLLKFHNVDFYADLLYDALDQAFGTVYSDKDDLSQGAIQFTIGP